MKDGEGERKRKDAAEDLPNPKEKQRKAGENGDGLKASEMEALPKGTGDAKQEVSGAGCAIQESKHDGNTCSTGAAAAATSALVHSVNTALAHQLADPLKRDFSLPKVSVIIPCHNAMPWLNDCLKSCCVQDYCGPLEVSVYNDASTDDSLACIKAWEATMTQLDINLIHSTRSTEEEDNPPHREASKEDARKSAGGAGRARNMAIRQSSGKYLCFLDADDVMAPDRITRQLEAAVQNPHAIVGGGFVREPADATEHYTRWCNTMEPLQLVLEQYREITVILPTWFFSRELFEKVGGFEEASPEKEGEAEDLSYFHRHLSVHASTDNSTTSLVRVGDAGSPVLMYRFSTTSSSWRTPRRKLLRLRVQAFEDRVLNGPRSRALWEQFTVWGGGRDSRQFISELSEAGAARVRALCDVDENKIGKEYFNHRSKSSNPPRIPIIHFSEAQGPVVVCVSKRRFSDDLDAELLRNVATLGLTEGHDLWFFI